MPTPRITHADTQDPTALALVLANLQGDMAVLQRETSSHIQNQTSAIHSLQADARHNSEQLAEVKALQERQLAQSEGLDRAFRAIEKLATSFEGWRERHEGENKVTSDCVTEFRGQLRGIWLAGGLVVTLTGAIVTVGGWWVNDRFADLASEMADGKAERVAVEARRQSTHDRDMQQIEKRLAEHAAEIEKLRLARGLR